MKCPPESFEACGDDPVQRMWFKFENVDFSEFVGWVSTCRDFTCKDRHGITEMCKRIGRSWGFDVSTRNLLAH